MIKKNLSVDTNPNNWYTKGSELVVCTKKGVEMFDDKIKLTLEMNGEVITIETNHPDRHILSNFLDLIPRLCVGAGWTPGTVANEGTLTGLEDWLSTFRKEEN